MNKKRTIIDTALGITVIVLFFNGIGRHDTPLKKYFDFAKDSIFDCVGEVFNSKGNKFIQSCVLISNQHIIATAHGFYEESKAMVNDSVTVLGKKYPIKRPAYSTLKKSSDFYIKIDGKIYQVEKIIIHPHYDDAFNSYGYNDIAIVKLKQEVVQNIKPAILYTDTLERGSRGIVCGYGAVLKASGSSFSFGKRKKMAGENMIDSLGGNYTNNKWGVLFADMDKPETVVCNRMGDAAPLPLELHGHTGDCGGGLFIIQNKEWRLAGISFAPSYYDDWKLYGQSYGYYGFIDGWTRVSPIADWIKSNIKPN